MSEIKWTDEGDFWSGDYRVIYSGMITEQQGILLIKEQRQSVESYLQYNHRMILVKLNADLTDLAVIQIYDL